MNTEQDIPALYRQMLTISTDMLNAADSEDWEKLISLEQQRSEVVGILQSAPNLIPDPKEERDVLIALIHDIQGCDERIRPRILSWMSELRTMFESAGNELKLGKKYGST